MTKAEIILKTAEAMADTLEGLVADTAGFIANQHELEREIDPDLSHDEILAILDGAMDILRRRDRLALWALNR